MVVFCCAELLPVAELTAVVAAWATLAESSTPPVGPMQQYQPFAQQAVECLLQRRRVLAEAGGHVALSCAAFELAAGSLPECAALEVTKTTMRSWCLLSTDVPPAIMDLAQWVRSPLGCRTTVHGDTHSSALQGLSRGEQKPGAR